MGKTKTLAKNTAIIGLGTLSTKILTFLLLPLYTNILNPDDYGLIDVLMTMSSLIIPFVTLEMNSGVFRFLIGFEDGENYSYKKIVSTGVAIETMGLIITLLISLVVNLFFNIPHFMAIVVYIVSLSASKLILDLTRGFSDIVAYSIANLIITLFSLCLNIVFILVFKWGAVSILIATAIGNFSGSVFLFFKERLYKYIGKCQINKDIGKKMLKYTLPLILNTVSWWIVSAADRIIILGCIGATANGIYAAAHKIPSIYTTLFAVFCLAWTESVARNESDKIFVKRTVEISVKIMIYMLLGIISCSSLFFNILIGDEYSSCYWHILILLIAIFFSSLSSLYGGIFSGKMDSKTIAYTTIIGAVINIIVNLGLVNYIGLYAASISTTISYIVIGLIRNKQVKKWYKIKLFSMKDIIFIPLGVLCIVGYYFHSNIINIITIITIIICFVLFNRNILNIIFIKTKNRK